MAGELKHKIAGTGTGRMASSSPARVLQSRAPTYDLHTRTPRQGRKPLTKHPAAKSPDSAGRAGRNPTDIVFTMSARIPESARGDDPPPARAARR